MIPSVMTTSWRTHANDVAQANVFHAILQVELAQACALAESAHLSWVRRCRGGIDDGQQVPEALAHLRRRVAEVQKLLDAVATRFLHE
jgi:hypothetical protein